MYVDNPAAKILIEISKTEDEEVGDGTTTVAVLAGKENNISFLGELLR